MLTLTAHWPCCIESFTGLCGSHLQLGHVVRDLEEQLGLMEHQCHSLNQDKEQLEEELHSKQAALHQAASDAKHTQALAAQAAHATHER